jgi:hypothetical protein
MSMFQCGKCGCVENTACTSFFDGEWTSRFKVPEEDMQYNKLPLCCICAPEHFKSGEPTQHTGEWHNNFSRVFLPLGEYRTNREGNIENIKTGSTDYYKHAIKIDPEIKIKGIF